MANCCEFEMHVRGKRDNVKKFCDLITTRPEERKNVKWFQRWIEAEVFYERDDCDVRTVYLCGDCAWSILIAMRRAEAEASTSLEEQSEVLGLVIEVYSSEPGLQFQEHFLVDHGAIIVDDCVDYEEAWIEDEDTLAEYNEKNGTSYTMSDLNCNGDLTKGGFEQWDFSI